MLDDEAHRRVMGRMGRARAEQFDWRWIGEKIESVYLSSMGGGLEDAAGMNMKMVKGKVA